MGINRAEKEALDAVCVIASPSGELKMVVEAIDKAIGNVKSIMQSGEIELPDEMTENMDTSLRQMEDFKQAYMAKSKDLSDCNQKLSDDIARRMANAQKSSSETKGQMAASKAAAEEIKGGTR